MLKQVFFLKNQNVQRNTYEQCCTHVRVGYEILKIITKRMELLITIIAIVIILSFVQTIFYTSIIIHGCLFLYLHNYIIYYT